MFIVLFILALNIFSSYAKNVNISYEPICVSQTCSKTAEKMREKIDPNVDPCTNFYYYACGNWIKNASSIPYSISEDSVENKLNLLLLTLLSSEENTSLGKMIKFFDSCMNIDKIESEGISDLLRIMDKNGGWPIIMSENDWISNNKSWPEIDLAFQKITKSSPIFTLRGLDMFKKNIPVVMLTHPSINVDRDIFSDTFLENFDVFMKLPVVTNYMNVIKNVSKVIASHRNFSLSEKTLEEDVINIIKFERELRLITKNLGINSSIEKEDAFDITTIKNFQQSYSSSCCKTDNSKINWLHIIRQYFNDIPEIINESQTIVVLKNYFPMVAKLLNRTSSRVIVNTIHWRFIIDFRAHMNREIRALLKTLPLLPTNFAGIRFRYSYCLINGREQFTHALSHVYIQKHFSKNAYGIGMKMVSEIVNEMEIMINSSTLLVDDLKLNLFTSLKTTKWFVGYADWYDNRTVMDYFYNDVKMSESWLENLVSMKKFNLNQQLKAFRELDINKKDWPLSPIMKNTYLAQGRHAVYVSAAMLDYLFDENLPDALNYGRIGFYIGHESIHATVEKATDSDEAKIDPSWNHTNSELLKGFDCFINQFSKYSLSFYNRTYKLDGQKTLNENVADTVGLRAAYKALQTRKKIKVESKMRLLGLEHLNSDQLFFLSYAQIGCTLDSPEALLQEMNDPHGPSVFRINGTLSNNEHFAEAFKCAKGTIMNPTQKCLLL